MDDPTTPENDDDTESKRAGGTCLFISIVIAILLFVAYSWLSDNFICILTLGMVC